MSSNPVFFWEINAHDGEKLTDFYNGVFDWNATADETGFHLIRSTDDKGKGIAGGVFTGKGQLPPHRALYVQVDSIDDTIEKARAAGADVLLEKFEGPGGSLLAFFEDPEGHMIGLVENE